jgi:hypothetical protein
MDRKIENITSTYLNHIHKFYNKVDVFLEHLEVVRRTRKFPGKKTTRVFILKKTTWVFILKNNMGVHTKKTTWVFILKKLHGCSY